MNKLCILVMTILVLPLVMSCGMKTQYERTDCSTLSGKDALRCIDYRQRKANAEISGEVSELLKGYRRCIQKHEGDIGKAKESCAVYRDVLEQIELSNMSCSCM